MSVSNWGCHITDRILLKEQTLIEFALLAETYAEYPIAKRNEPVKLMFYYSGTHNDAIQALFSPVIRHYYASSCACLATGCIFQRLRHPSANSRPIASRDSSVAFSCS